jgi:hypothetical protein
MVTTLDRTVVGQGCAGDRGGPGLRNASALADQGSPAEIGAGGCSTSPAPRRLGLAGSEPQSVLATYSSPVAVVVEGGRIGVWAVGGRGAT